MIGHRSEEGRVAGDEPATDAPLGMNVEPPHRGDSPSRIDRIEGSHCRLIESGPVQASQAMVGAAQRGAAGERQEVIDEPWIGQTSSGDVCEVEDLPADDPLRVGWTPTVALSRTPRVGDDGRRPIALKLQGEALEAAIPSDDGRVQTEHQDSPNVRTKGHFLTSYQQHRLLEDRLLTPEIGGRIGRAVIGG